MESRFFSFVNKLINTMVILGHPTGNANSRAVADGLMASGLLAKFHTSIALFPGSALDKLASFKPLSDLKRRTFNKSLKPLTTTHPGLEIARMIALKLNLTALLTHETGPFCIDALYGFIDKKVGGTLLNYSLLNTKAIYAYEDAALQSFKAAKKKGLKCCYDLPIGYWRSARKYLEAELEIWPEWAVTLGGLKDSAKKLAKKDEELALADNIFVASSFTAKTLNDYPGKLAPIEIIPYGFPKVNNKRVYPLRAKKLKLLFVGGLSQRKGLANLFAVANKFGEHIELTIVGGKGPQECAALNKELVKYKWIPTLAHHAVLKLMGEHDLLIFPSLFEGFGLVITEAMSQGTPVITTDRTAGADLIKHGENGWIVEAGATDELFNTIESLLGRHDLIAEVGAKAMETAKKRPWEVYGAELAASINCSIQNTI